MRRMTVQKQITEAIIRLVDVLGTVRSGYPYYGVPKDVAYALRVLRRVKKEGLE